MVKYSFVLLCFNNWSMTKQAITSLLKSLDSSLQSNGVELIIVDNGSTDETPVEIDRIKEKYEQGNLEIHKMRLERNMGYTPAINAGLSKCQGRIISVLNNDLVFPDNWFNGLVDVLESNKEIGLAAPYLSKSSGIQNVNMSFNSIEEMSDFAADFMKREESKVVYTHRVIGACMVFKQEVLRLVGGNDIWFGLGQFDDDDLCFRTLVAGYKIAVVGKSFVHHISSVTYKQQSDLLEKTFLVNKEKMRNKWGSAQKAKRKISKKVRYSREKHFFPTRQSDFSPYPQNLNRGGHKYLLVADWTHSYSKWKSKLLDAIGTNAEIHLWIPDQYFKRSRVLGEISNLLGFDTLRQLKVNHENISPSDYMMYLNLFDGIYEIEDDFINRYMVSLSSSIPIRVL